jgi:cyclopropane fatty-acyl-phospholipid synthase-like methyltransferase
MNVIWHDLECGAYAADTPLWRSLADRHGDPVLDVGAGSGRIALDLARHGHRVTALDHDPMLIAELERRADGLELETTVSDARDFELEQRFPLIIAPMQTIQLLGGSDGRRRFLGCARRHLESGGVVALAITEALERYDAREGFLVPMPDIRELDGVVYSSQPTAVREDADGFVLERVRETITPDGQRTIEEDLIRLDRLTAAELERQGQAVGLEPGGRMTISPTRDHVGSEVVVLHG